MHLFGGICKNPLSVIVMALSYHAGPQPSSLRSYVARGGIGAR
jgi:hypothetical protein